MNEQQRSNLSSHADIVGGSIYEAWSYLRALRGMQIIAVKHPDHHERHATEFSVIYGALFDALYVKVGTIIDGSAGSLSLPGLRTKALRYVDEEQIRKTLQAALYPLDDAKGPVRRLRNWRMNHAAHRSHESFTPEFYKENSLRFDEIEDALRLLNDVLNSIVKPSLGTHYLLGEGNLDLANLVADLIAPKQ